MKQSYETPMIEVIELEVENFIAQSGEHDNYVDPWDEWFGLQG